MRRQLKPRGVGDTIGETFSVLVDNGAAILGVVAIVTVPIQLISLILANALVDYDRLSENELAFDADALSELFAFVAVGILLALAANALASGAVVHAVGSAYIGQQTTVGRSVSFAAAHLGVLILATLLFIAGIVAGFFLFVIPAVIIGVGWAVFASAALIEDTSATGAIRRAWQLTSGRKWQVFGVFFALAILGVVFNSIVTAITSGLGQDAQAAPTLTTSIITIAASVLSTSVASTSTVVVYLELRARKEGPEVVAEAVRQRLEPGSTEQSGPDLFR